MADDHPEAIIKRIRRLANDLHRLEGPARAHVLAALEGLIAEARVLSSVDESE